MELPPFEVRRRRFDAAAARLPERRWTCPCCAFPTLQERGVFGWCPLCDWEDDGQDDAHAAELWGGPNGDLTLARARANVDRHLWMHDDRPDPDREALRQAAADAFLSWAQDPTPPAWARALEAERRLSESAGPFRSA